MTYPTDDPVREFLDSARFARAEFNRLSQRVKQLEAQCTSITAALSATPGGGGNDAERMWAALADESARLYPQLREAQEREHEVENFINKLEDPAHRLILKLRYLDTLSWPNVNRQLSCGGVFYSDRQIYRLHGDALAAARALWAQEREEDGE